MTVEPISSDQLAEVRRIATALAEHMLEAVAARSEIPPEPAVALANAAVLLREHQVELPPPLVEALYTLAAKTQNWPAPQFALPDAAANVIDLGLSCFFAKARTEAEQP